MRRRHDAIGERRPHHAAGVEGDVEADGVVERDRPHRHAEGRGGAVDRLDRRPLFEQQQRLVHVRQQHAVHEEAGAVVDDDRRLADPPCVGRGGGDRVVAGRAAADHFDQRHHAHRVEEVEAAELLGPREPAGEVADRNRRGVRAEHGVGGQLWLQAGVELALGLGVLVDRFDDEVGGGEFGVADGAVDQRRQRERLRHVGPFGLLVEAGLGEDALHAAADGLVRRVAERDGNAALDVRRRDPLPHDAGADDADRADVARRSLAGADLLVEIAQEEDVEQRAIDRRAEERRKAFGFHLAGGFDVDAGGAEHHLQRGERRRVVALGLTLDVGARRGAEEAELGLADVDRAKPTAAVFEVLLCFAVRRGRGGSRRRAARRRRRSSRRRPAPSRRRLGRRSVRRW